MEDNGLLDLRKHAGVDGGVVVGVAGDGGERAAGHEDDASAGGFDGFALVEVGAGDVVKRVGVSGGEAVGARAAEEECSARVSGCRAALDEFEGERPVEAHAALGGVHGLGHAKAKRPEVFAVGKSCVPIEDGMSQGFGGAEGIDYDVGSSEGDAGSEWIARYERE